MHSNKCNCHFSQLHVIWKHRSSAFWNTSKRKAYGIMTCLGSAAFMLGRIMAAAVHAVQAIEPLFSMQAAFHTNDGSFVNNEFIDVYLITVKDEIPVQTFVLQEEEVAAVRSACQHSLIAWPKSRSIHQCCDFSMLHLSPCSTWPALQQQKADASAAARRPVLSVNSGL